MEIDSGSMAMKSLVWTLIRPAVYLGQNRFGMRVCNFRRGCWDPGGGGEDGAWQLRMVYVPTEDGMSQRRRLCGPNQLGGYCGDGKANWRYLVCARNIEIEGAETWLSVGTILYSKDYLYYLPNLSIQGTAQ